LVEKEFESKIDDAARKMYENLEECWLSANDNFIEKEEEGVYEDLEKFIKISSAAYDMDIMKKGYL